MKKIKITAEEVEIINEMVEQIEDFIATEIEKVWEGDMKLIVYDLITIIVRQRARNIEQESELL